MRFSFFTRLFLMASVMTFSATTALAEYRFWTDIQGRKLEAEFIRVDGNYVTLQTRDGAQHRFPMSNLSAIDQKLAGTLKPRVIENVAGKDVTAAAALIDRLVDMGLARNNWKPNEMSTDEEFVRRIYLDIAGTIPNYEQTISFIRSSDQQKRSKLINQLLESEGYVSHMYNYFADMLRLTQNLDNNVGAEPYLGWVKDQVRSNAPYNVMVKEMLTATGKVWENPASGYLLRDSGMPLDNLAITTSIFLGTDIACAQCHDHPFDDWTQLNFYETASFFGATTTRVGGGGDRVKKEVTDLLVKAGYRNPTPTEMEANTRIEKDLSQTMRNIDDLIDANRFVVANLKENRLRLPQDYNYDNATPGGFVQPKFMVWPDAGDKLSIYNVNLDNVESLRDVFGEWATSPENPRFSITIANRMWKRAFGVGIVEPVDGIKTPEESANPQLLIHLGNEMKRLNYSLKDFMRVVYHTKAYQRKSMTNTPEMGAHYYFPGPVLRRMTAQQAWDSFMTLVVGNPDKFKASTGEYVGRALDLNLEQTTGQIVLQKFAARSKVSMMDKMEEGGKLEMAMEDENNKVINVKGMRLMRASELEQPASGSHFLRQFGQSDRQVKDSDSTAGSVPQVLMLMNGPAQEVLTSKDSLIFRTIDSQQDPSDRIDVMFYSILNRKPTFREMDIVKREFSASPSNAYSNIIWALINTREFMFVK
jgi:hypothetical protein